MKKYLILSLTLALTACNMMQNDDDQATAIAIEWGEAFFNCDYHAAEALSTPDSRRWLQFAASNTTQQDLDLLKQHAAEVEATDFFPEANDTLRVVELAVRNSVHKLKRLCSVPPSSSATAVGWLEWQAYREVKSKVATEFRME